MKRLLKHQLQALDYAKPLARIALFMEMRLGKTLVAIRWVEANAKDIKRTLVLSPKSVLPNWYEELLEEGYALEDIKLLEGTTQQRENQCQNNEAKWFLTNYETITHNPAIARLKWDCIILDESTKIRNPKADITKILIKQTSIHTMYKAILTGLPCPESELDYIEQFRFLYGSFMRENNYWWWRKKYAMQIGYDWVVNSHVSKLIKEEVHRLAFVLTRNEAGIGSEKIYEKRYTEMSDQQKKLYKQIEKEFAYEYEKENKTTKYVPVKMDWLARIAGGFTPEGTSLGRGKIEEILDLLRNELKGEKVIIWFKFNHELFEVAEALRRADFKIGVFTGNEKSGLAPDNSLLPETQIMCAQGKCGMYGLPWHAASTVINYSYWYDGEIREQSIDRVINPLKKEPILIIDLICKGTIDEDAVKILREKKVTATYFMSKLNKIWRNK